MSYDKNSINLVVISGNTGQDVSLKTTSGGTSVATVSVATTKTWQEKDGNKQEATTWHKVVVWDKLAEIVAQYCHKGSKVTVKGSLQNRSWEDKDGVKRYITEIVADQFLIAGSKGNGVPLPEEPEGNVSVNEPAEVNENVDDDLPF
jgi:single-strand DNA-binding protein